MPSVLETLYVPPAIVRYANRRSPHPPEINRLRGLLRQATGDDPEASYRTSLAIARKQSARLFQLRTAMSLADLWQSRGKTTEARALLREAYDWFREGHDTPLLRAAKDALDRL